MTKEKPQALALRRKLEKQLKLELTNSTPRTWGSSIYGIGVDADILMSNGVFNYTNEDRDAQYLLRCPFCDFEIDFSSAHIRPEEVPICQLCPVCDKELGKDAIRAIKKSSPQKSALESDNSSVKLGEGCSGNTSEIPNANGSMSDAPPQTGDEVVEEKRD